MRVRDFSVPGAVIDGMRVVCASAARCPSNPTVASGSGFEAVSCMTDASPSEKRSSGNALDVDVILL